jgi:GT2 family glycosyltransferase/glycosyltransferase involved in cell wall biosynthesis
VADGPATLVVRATDTRGNRREVAVEIRLQSGAVVQEAPSPAASPGAAGSPLVLNLDTPRAGATIDDILLVGGWAYSTAGAIVRLEAWVGERLLGALRYGNPRPDVRAHQPALTTDDCGFYEIVPAAGLEDGSHALVVRALDAGGHAAEARVPFRVRRDGKPLAEIERASWRDALIEVDGWAICPAADQPAYAQLIIDGEVVSRSRVHLSRPDVWERRQTSSTAFRSGFHLVHRLDPAGAGGDTASAFVAIAGNRGELLRLPLRLQREATASPAVDQTAWAKLLEDYAGRYGRPPALLDWTPDRQVVAALPEQAVFAPVDGAAATLPYLDQSVDLVVVRERDAARQAEARRVARDGLVVLPDGGAPAAGSDPPTGPAVEWLSPPEAGAGLPSASVIIPTYNAARLLDDCLTQTVATLPAGLPVEIIVVDDASTDETPAVLRRWTEREARVKVVRNEQNLRFLRACNRGARAATGDVLVFLNNDTLPQPGWLPPLLRLLVEHPAAGAAGGKLIYPDGRLQEAGGVIFADGSGWNVGRGDARTEHFLFDYVREVDYCSGALLATWRQLFLEEGGFDERFVPMYYEDTDYCFSLRAKGRKVYYQPASVVIHREGGTAGTDITQGVKAYQAVNRERFLEKWGAVLAERQPPPDRVTDEALLRVIARGAGRSRRRALVMTALMPAFDRESGGRRSFDLMQILREAGWEVHCFAQSAQPPDMRYARILQQMGIAVSIGDHSSGIGDAFTWNANALIEHGEFDLAILGPWYTAERYLPTIRSLSPATRILVDSVDLHFLREARQHLRAARGAAALDTAFGRRLARECMTYRAADGVLTVSEKEAAFINDVMASTGLARCVPDLEDLPPAVLPAAQRRGLLFLGSFRHRPNVEAVEFLLTEILPRLDPAVLRQHPLRIVGNGLDARALHAPYDPRLVELVGWVPSVVPYLQHSRLTVLPLLHGAGTKRKLIQALACGTPSVSTTVGIEGLALRHEEEVLVADTAEDFARQIERLVADETVWQRLSDQGRSHITSRHGRAAVREALLAAVEAALGGAAR